MPVRTQIYKLDYFKQGSYYSSLSDYKRFVTLDYNLESFIGVVGVGVISGWTIEHLDGLNIQILPGNGIIDGYYCESPYTVKLRSDMVDGDREIEIVNEDDIPEEPLDPTQRAQYVSIIRLYNPSFNPIGDIENAYVKVVIPSILTILDNQDTYIYAQRSIGQKPYPLLNDYPPPAGKPPVRSNYSTYDAYKVDLDIYDAKLEAIHDYEWYTSSSNHFTEISFLKLSNQLYAFNRVLIGRVSSRSGTVVKIDTSGVDNLSNMESQIRQVATEYLVEHKHGGSKSFDPPKIRLETDIRDTVLSGYDITSGTAIYSVLDRNETSISLGHKHTYQIDADGNGQTIEQTGSSDPHFHKINSRIVDTQESTPSVVKDHIHTIPSETTADTWGASSRYLVYVNDVLFADETTSYVHADYQTKLITFDRGVSVLNNKYSCSFYVTLTDPSSGVSTKIDYSFTERNVSVLSFMFHMINDYNVKMAKYLKETSSASSLDIVVSNISASPFIFFDSEGNIVGTEDLFSQCSAAQVLLKSTGDQFKFTPNAANNLVITLMEQGVIDTVTLEILGNTEVTGKLRPENIVYVNANKILTGEFIPQVIPFVSHIGRFKEECLPLQLAMVSNDGVRYDVVPTITDVSLNHYHRISVDKQTDGVSTDVMVDNDVVYYENDNNDNTYFIYHAHGVINGTVSEASSSGLLNWVNNVGSNSLTSSVHTHNVSFPVIGNDKTIYSIQEDIDGNIYVGTSNGFMIVPQSPSYLFVINGVEIYLYGDDLWNVLGKAKMQYELETGNPFVLTEDLYRQQVIDAIPLLVQDGDSVLLSGTGYPDRETDRIMIKRISSFALPNFKYEEEKNISEVLDTETVIATVPSSDASVGDTVVVERNFNNTPIWSFQIKTSASQGSEYVVPVVSTDIVVAGSNLIAKGVGINQSPYNPWSSVNILFSIGVIRKVIKDSSENYWICSDGGVFASRSYNDGNIFNATSIPAGNPDVLDILSGVPNAVYCASTSGIFKTTDGGKAWVKIFDATGGFKQIIRDRILDKTSTVSGHYHYMEVNIDGNGLTGESVGAGDKHIHSVSSWNIASTSGHSHGLIVVLYALDNNKIIWKSIDNGSSWVNFGILPDGECGDIFASSGYLFVSQDDGLYRTQNGSEWTKVLSSKVYSYEWTYDMSGFYVGCDNILYSTVYGDSFDVVFELSGIPSPVLLINGEKSNFGYAYSNISQTFHFKEMTIESDEMNALIDFGKWYAVGGSWENSDLYDVYINYKRVLSTKYKEDKRNIFGYNFTVIPAEGALDFNASSNLTHNIAVYDDTIEVSNAAGFSSGDLIVIMSNNSSAFSTIASISGNQIELDSRLTQDMLVPLSVRKIPSLNNSSNILVNIYNSLLSNIGVLTHDQVEDGLSNYSDGRPYKFNDTYLSNLLQLTQAVRYVYPDINSEFINDLFYDFRYSWSPSDPLYPSIYDYIDVVTSDIYNQKVYDSIFSATGSKSINKILIGYGSFSGNIFVATDIGVFWAKIEEGMEANWFYVNEMNFGVFDLSIFGGTRLLAATNHGTYYTDDMITWTLEYTPAIYYPSYSLGLRWTGDNSVTVPSHEADFISDVANSTGQIIATSGTPYNVLEENQGIKITGAGDKNGSYIVQNISDGGTGAGSEITVSPSFSGPDGIKSGVEITMGTWWGQWNGDENTSNPNITNTLLVGGENHISYNDGGDVWSWREAFFGDASDFISRKFYPLSNGRLLLAATGTKSTNRKNYLLKSDDIGKTWNIFKDFQEIKGIIDSTKISDFNNTTLTVSYTQPESYVYADGILDQQDISIFTSNSTIALFKGKIVWNERKNGMDTITVFGSDLSSSIALLQNCEFIVYPGKVNTMIQTSKGTLFYGTDRGIYYDVNTVVSNVHPEGTINVVGTNGTVQKIDISGNIISVNQNAVTGNSLLSVASDIPIRGQTLDGKDFYITDTDPVEKYQVVGNGSVKPGEESLVEINIVGALPSSYVGKRFRISGKASRVYINFDLPVSNNQFNGGTMFVNSHDQNNNYGKTYTIAINGTDYVDLSEVIVPASTLVRRIGDTEITPPNTSLQVGQNVRLIDASGKLTMTVIFDRDLKENSLKDLSLGLSGVSSDRNVDDVTIFSNLKNSVTLNTGNALDYQSGDNFVIIGAMFEQLGGFSHLETSIDSGHYHNVETVNAIVSGKIQSFGFRNASYVDVNVSETSNFNTPIVQLMGNLFEDAKIVFTNSNNSSMRYTSEVVSHTPTSIRVRITSSSYWNFIDYDSLKISEGWCWEIDGTNYGYTDGIIYDDFVEAIFGLTVSANRGTDILRIEDTSTLIVGDKIRIQDDTLSYEINSVKQIVNATTIKTVSVLGRTYFESRNPQIKVLRDVFTNTHVHQIRNNEIQPLFISEYLDHGYSSEHAHRVLPLITDVSVLLERSSGVLALGSDSIIYNSSDNGLSWGEVINLNDYLEGTEDISGVSTAILNDGKLVVGATNGNIFVETENKNGMVALNYPK